MILIINDTHVLYIQVARKVIMLLGQPHFTESIVSVWLRRNISTSTGFTSTFAKLVKRIFFSGSSNLASISLPVRTSHHKSLSPCRTWMEERSISQGTVSSHFTAFVSDLLLFMGKERSCLWEWQKCLTLTSTGLLKRSRPSNAHCPIFCVSFSICYIGILCQPHILLGLFKM